MVCGVFVLLASAVVYVRVRVSFSVLGPLLTIFLPPSLPFLSLSLSLSLPLSLSLTPCVRSLGALPSGVCFLNEYLMRLLRLTGGGGAVFSRALCVYV